LKKHGKPIGISTGSTDPEVQKYWFDLGINIISTGTDYHYLMHGAKANLAQMRRMFEGK
jgi:2-keto-3-deoxy-L-rhamnonate aldolase RhmA